MSIRVSPVKVIRYTKKIQEAFSDLVALEEPLEIKLGFGPEHERRQIALSVTMRTPGNDFELAAGFLFTETIIQKSTDIMHIQYCTDSHTYEITENSVRVELVPSLAFDASAHQRHFYTTSSCGICGKASIEAIRQTCAIILKPDLRVEARVVYGLVDQLATQQTVFKHTGGIHACALYTPYGELLLTREDVGRHNAMDKLAGAIWMKDASVFEHSIVLFSGRASFELIQKAAVCGIPVVCAVGAPSSLAITTAEEMGITLIGFLRENRFNVYTHAYRIQM